MRGEPEPNGKMTKGELENLLRAFRLNARAAKTSIVNLGAKLKAEFEVQLNTKYPSDGDPVWEEEYKALLVEWENDKTGSINARLNAASRNDSDPVSKSPSGVMGANNVSISSGRNCAAWLMLRLTRW
jgi:hypothetical protein